MFGLKKKITQDFCLISETNRVTDQCMDTGTVHAECEDSCEAWGLDAGQQCIDEQTGRYVQFISSLSCNPIKIYQERNHYKEASIALISSQTEDKEMTYTSRNTNKNSMLLWVGICVALLSLTVLVIAVMRVI